MNEWQTKIFDYIDSSKDFLLEQMPDIFSQIIKWKLVSLSVGLILSLLFLAFSIGIIVYFSSEKRQREIFDDTKIVVTISFGILSLGSLIFVGVNLFYLLQVIYAPKIFLINYFKG